MHIRRVFLPKAWIFMPRKRPFARSDWRGQRIQGLRARGRPATPSTSHLPPHDSPPEPHQKRQLPTAAAKRTPKPSKPITCISVLDAPLRASNLTPTLSILRRVSVAKRSCARPRGHLAPEPKGVAWQTFCSRHVPATRSGPKTGLSQHDTTRYGPALPPAETVHEAKHTCAARA